MARWTVDPLNPGEVLACCGIAYLAWIADRTAVTGFVQEDRWHFRAPDGVLDAIPAPAPSATPMGLTLCGLALDWWQPWGLNPELANWSGQQDEMTVHRDLADAATGLSARAWQSHATITKGKGRLNLDIQGTWNALSLGWSLNEHKHRMITRPWLELLASLGLQAFPVGGGRRDGFLYYLWHPAPLAAAVPAFQGDGPGVYALRGFTAATDKLGKNTMLLRATPNR